MNEFQERACAASLAKMLSGKHFDICKLDAIAETMGVRSRLGGPDYAALRGLHCMDWAEMGPDLSRMAREKCFELLGLPPTVIDAVTEARPSESAAPQRASRLRLAFGWGK